MVLCSSFAQAADKVVVIPLMSSNKSGVPEGGLNFDITDDGVTFTSLSKGWTFAGATTSHNSLGVQFTFITNKGYIFTLRTNSVSTNVTVKEIYLIHSAYTGGFLIFSLHTENYQEERATQCRFRAIGKYSFSGKRIKRRARKDNRIGFINCCALNRPQR